MNLEQAFQKGSFRHRRDLDGSHQHECKPMPEADLCPACSRQFDDQTKVEQQRLLAELTQLLKRWFEQRNTEEQRLLAELNQLLKR